MKAPKFQEVRVYDYSNYVSGKASNGGSYGFWSVIRPVGEDTYEKEYHTTAGFQFCGGCGAFSDCNCQPWLIKTAEVEALIREYNTDEHPDVYAEVKAWALDTRKLRRRIEDHLRKTDSVSDLLMVADKLGVSLSE